MGVDWQTARLGDVIAVKHGYAFQGEFINDAGRGDVLLTPGNFAIGGGFKADKLKFYEGPVPDGFVLNQGDLVVTMTDLSKQSDTLGFPAIVPARTDGRRYLHNQRIGKVIVLKPQKIDAGFLNYLLRVQDYRNEVLASATGTTVKHTAPVRILNYQFARPPLREQQAIARVLASLDGKIELNRRMSETLEAMTRALFKSWFIDFDPVRAQMERRDTELAKPFADLFRGRFVHSECGEIPEGWRTGRLGDAADNPRRGVQPDEIERDTPYIALEHMPRRSIALSEWGTADDLGSNKYQFKRGEILFGKLRPYFHKVGIAPLDGVCSTDIVVVAPKEDAWFAFVLGHVSSVEFVDFVNAGSTGTKMPRTSWSEMARYPLALPPLPIADAFMQLVKAMLERIVVGIHQSRALAELRDALLPKLISGELRVKHAERAVAESV